MNLEELHIELQALREMSNSQCYDRYECDKKSMIALVEEEIDELERKSLQVFESLTNFDDDDEIMSWDDFYKMKTIGSL